jgi:hypothetical protein
MLSFSEDLHIIVPRQTFTDAVGNQPLYSNWYRSVPSFVWTLLRQYIQACGPLSVTTTVPRLDYTVPT